MKRVLILFSFCLIVFNAYATEYVYHMKQKFMQGKTLYPLNQLKNFYPDAYGNAIEKYKGREFLMSVKVPILGAFWNDFIFLSPIHPHILYKEYLAAMKQSGLENLPAEREFYKISIEKINESKCVVHMNSRLRPCDYSQTGQCEDHYTDIWIKDFYPISIADYKEMNEVPQNTKEYFLETFKENKLPMLFVFIPHIMVQDSIDISDAQIIKWSEEE